jgi:hypothetical protein
MTDHGPTLATMVTLQNFVAAIRRAGTSHVAEGHRTVEPFSPGESKYAPGASERPVPQATPVRPDAISTSLGSTDAHATRRPPRRLAGRR